CRHFPSPLRGRWPRSGRRGVLALTFPAVALIPPSPTLPRKGLSDSHIVAQVGTWRDGLSSPLWGGVGGGGASTELNQRSARTPTLALPTRGRGERAASPPGPIRRDV